MTSCKFLYGTTPGYGKEAACAPAPGGGTEPVPVSAALGGLAQGTVYHYKLVAESAAGKGEGVDAEFKTAEPPPPPPPPPPPGKTTPETQVLPQVVTKPVPNVTIAGTSISVPSNGAFGLKLSCPTGETQCAGTVTLKTLTAVAAGSSHKKSILTLTSGSFTIAGGNLKVLTLHLSSKAKALLAKSHTVRARVTILAHDPAGGTHTTTVIVTLKAAKKKH